VDLWLEKNQVTRELLNEKAGRELSHKELYIMAIECERKGVSIYKYEEAER
jgi:hypothetical protein